MVCASATKTTQASHLGLRLWAPPTKTPNAPVLLVHLDDHGLFTGKLKAGLQIIQINDFDCRGKSVAQVEALLQRLVGRVTVWGSAPQPFATSPVTVQPPVCSASSSSSSCPEPSLDLTEASDDDDDSTLSLESITLQDHDNSSSFVSSEPTKLVVAVPPVDKNYGSIMSLFF